MLIKRFYEKTILDIFASHTTYLFFILFVPLVLLIDILLLPFELIALILYRIVKGVWNDD